MALLYLTDNYGHYRCDELDYEETPDYDALNSKRSRGVDNTLDEDYNCFGYALGTYNWGVPFITYSYLYELSDDGIVGADDINEYEQDMIYEIIDISDRVFHAKLDYESAGVIAEIIMCANYDDTFALEIAKAHMLAAFPDLRAIDSFDELLPDEYGIVYAAATFDFHYARYYPEHGYYCHKNGRLEPEIVFFEDDVFRGYNSRRLYFAKKRKDDVCLVPA